MSINSFSAAVTLSCAGAPVGITCGYAPNPITPPSNGSASSTLTVTVGAGVAAGTYSFQVSGMSTSPALTRTAPLKVFVPGTDYRVDASPSAISLSQGANGMSTATVSSLSGYSATVAMAAGSVLPVGLTSGFAPTSVVLTANGTANSIVTITATATAPVGPAAFRITGSVGAQVRGFTLNLNVLTPAGQGTGVVQVDTHAQTGTSSNLNGVFEPGETMMATPSWANSGGSSVTLTGTSSSFMGPAGATYTIVDSTAGYDTILAGGSADCFAATGNCYVLQVSNPFTRPVLHWDTTYQESLSNGTTKTWTVHVGRSFTDVLTSNSFYTFVETVLHNGITSGCGSTTYCPDSSVLRQEMAVFLLKAEHGTGYVPPPCTGIFTDVPCPATAQFPYSDWIEELSNEEVTTGCGVGTFCPGSPSTRGDKWQSFSSRSSTALRTFHRSAGVFSPTWHARAHLRTGSSSSPTRVLVRAAAEAAFARTRL